MARKAPVTDNEDCDQFLERFHDFQIVDLRRSKRTAYEKVWFIKKLLSVVRKRPTEISREDLRSYLKTLESYSASYYKNALMALKVFFRDFLEAPEAVSSFKFPHQVFKPKQIVSKEQLRQFYECLETKKEIARRTDFSTSEVRELVKKGLADGYIERCTRKIRRKPGRLPSRGQRKRAGRPSYYYYLNGNGKWLIRLDPEVRDRWDEVEIAYEKLIEYTIFDGYANLVYAIRKSAELRKYQRPHYFMDDELQRTVLNPFLYVDEYRAKEVTQLYDELVGVIKTSVRSEDVIGYYSALEESLKELNIVVDCHKALMKKMRILPEVQEYLRKSV